MDSGWLTTRNKPKVQAKPTKSKYRTGLTKQKSSSPVSNFILTQNSPPPKQLFTATKQSSLTAFFKPVGTYDDIQEVPYQPDISEEEKVENETREMRNTRGIRTIDSDRNIAIHREDECVELQPNSDMISKLQSGITRNKRKREVDIDRSDDSSFLHKQKHTIPNRRGKYFSDMETESNSECASINHKRAKSLHDHLPGNSQVNQTGPHVIATQMDSEIGARNSGLPGSNNFEADKISILPGISWSIAKQAKESKTEKIDTLFNDATKSLSVSFLQSSSSSLDIHTNPTQSLDLEKNIELDSSHSLEFDNEFTLRSQREKYDALENAYKHRDAEGIEINISDVLSCSPVSDCDSDSETSRSNSVSSSL